MVVVGQTQVPSKLLWKNNTWKTPTCHYGTSSQQHG
jgi:hypothetical protein